MNDTTFIFDQKYISLEVNIGDAISSGSAIGHVIDINHKGYVIYFSDSQQKVIYDGLTVKKAKYIYNQFVDKIYERDNIKP